MWMGRRRRSSPSRPDRERKKERKGPREILSETDGQAEAVTGPKLYRVLKIQGRRTAGSFKKYASGTELGILRNLISNSTFRIYIYIFF